MYRFKGFEHHCLECGDALPYGRANRKFCSETCKNRWHNRSKSISWERYEQKVIRILERNHQILMGLIALGIDSADMIDLVQMGFDFNFITSYRKIGRRNRYCCFEIRYEIYGERVIRIEETSIKKTGRDDPSGKK